MTALVEEERAADALWTDRFSQRAARATSSVIREFLKLLDDPEVISFAGEAARARGLPRPADHGRHPEVLEQRADAALQYGATEGYRPLRELLVRHMGRYGIEVGPENVLITSGAQQALDLVGKAFINPGDRVVTEDRPTSAPSRRSRPTRPTTSVPVDDDGMCVNRLEEALRAAPSSSTSCPTSRTPAASR